MDVKTTQGDEDIAGNLIGQALDAARERVQDAVGIQRERDRLRKRVAALEQEQEDSLKRDDAREECMVDYQTKNEALREKVAGLERLGEWAAHAIRGVVSTCSMQGRAQGELGEIAAAIDSD